MSLIINTVVFVNWVCRIRNSNWQSGVRTSLSLRTIVTHTYTQNIGLLLIRHCKQRVSYWKRVAHHYITTSFKSNHSLHESYVYHPRWIPITNAFIDTNKRQKEMKQSIEQLETFGSFFPWPCRTIEIPRNGASVGVHVTVPPKDPWRNYFARLCNATSGSRQYRVNGRRLLFLSVCREWVSRQKYRATVSVNGHSGQGLRSSLAGTTRLLSFRKGELRAFPFWLRVTASATRRCTEHPEVFRRPCINDRKKRRDRGLYTRNVTTFPPLKRLWIFKRRLRSSGSRLAGHSCDWMSCCRWLAKILAESAAFREIPSSREKTYRDWKTVYAYADLEERNVFLSGCRSIGSRNKFDGFPLTYTFLRIRNLRIKN